MEQDPKPWEVDAALQEDRLRFIAELLLEIREQVAYAQEPDKATVTGGSAVGHTSAPLSG